MGGMQGMTLPVLVWTTIHGAGVQVKTEGDMLLVRPVPEEKIEYVTTPDLNKSVYEWADIGAPGTTAQES